MGVLLSFIKAEENSYAKPAIISIHVLVRFTIVDRVSKKKFKGMNSIRALESKNQLGIKHSLIFPMLQSNKNLIASNRKKTFGTNKDWTLN